MGIATVFWNLESVGGLTTWQDMRVICAHLCFQYREVLSGMVLS